MSSGPRVNTVDLSAAAAAAKSLAARTSHLALWREMQIDELDNGEVQALVARVTCEDATLGFVTVSFCAMARKPLRLHWATADAEGAPWQAPPPGWTTRPPKSCDGGGGAWVTEFEPVGEGCQAVDIKLPAQRDTLAFLLRFDGGNRDRWVKRRGGRDMYVKLSAPQTLGPPVGPPQDPTPLPASPQKAPTAIAQEPKPKLEPAPAANASATPQPAERLASAIAVAEEHCQGPSGVPGPLVWAEDVALEEPGVVGYVVRVHQGNDGARKVFIAARSDAPVTLFWALMDERGGAWRAPSDGAWRSSCPGQSRREGPATLTAFEPSSVGVDAGALATWALEVWLDRAAAGEIFGFLLRTEDGRFVKRDGQDIYVPLSHAAATAVTTTPPPSRKDDKKRRRDERHGGGDGRRVERVETPEQAAQAAAEALAAAEAEAASALLPPERVERLARQPELLRSDGGTMCGGGAFDERLADEVARGEDGCQRSLMHRFNFAADLLDRAASLGEKGIVVLFTWFRFMAMRQLVINKNYNIKPREISGAQERVTVRLSNIYRDRPELREVVRITMATIGRGGNGAVGQRIRDEILDVQKKNDCKGGMMEEWHQKLHNNTCPDDVAICEALLEYIDGGLDISKYWARLAQDRITKERLGSYDRRITSEPRFRGDQCAGLRRDLREYLKTLKAVHSGADLDSAAGVVLGYSQSACKGVAVQVAPIAPVATPKLRKLLDLALRGAEHARQGGDPLLALEPMMEARWELRPWTAFAGGAEVGDRLKDVLYLDLALEAAVRTTIEGSLARISDTPLTDAMNIAFLALENLTMSSGGNHELVLCLKQFRHAADAATAAFADTADERRVEWALLAKAAMDRVQRELASQSERWASAVRAPAEGLGRRLRVADAVINVFPEEVVRGGPAAPLAQLLRALDPMLRKLANLGAWQIISPARVYGRLVCVDKLATVQLDVYPDATVLLARHVGGDEEIPEGVVGLITTDAPDVLSHVAVRARNEKCFFASLLDAALLQTIADLQGAVVVCTPSASGDSATVVKGSADSCGRVDDMPDSRPGGTASIAIKPASFCGRFAVSSVQFNPEVVGGKSRNLTGLRGRLPEWIHLPASVALPYGCFDEVLAVAENSTVAAQLRTLLSALAAASDASAASGALGGIRHALTSLRAPTRVTSELSQAFAIEGLPWPGDFAGAGAAAWAAIVGVWASKWNERAFLSCRKVGLDHSAISMAVLCQEVVRAQYAFVIHTTNPSTCNREELYAEVVCGLGETLVGNYAGRALSFSAPKNDLSRLVVKSFPSKSVGLFVDVPSLIFRSDSNAEDLEGFAGAGLYDSIVAGEGALERPIDYAGDRLICDAHFRRELLRRIAEVGCCIERALGSPQDVEGAVDAEGRVVVVQTRPQV